MYLKDKIKSLKTFTTGSWTEQKVSLDNKILIFNQVRGKIWLCGIQLWGYARNIRSVQTYQNKVLRNIVKTPWYVRNIDLHRFLGIPVVKVKEDIKVAGNQEARLYLHSNAKAL